MEEDGRSPLILHKWQWKIESGYQIILENFCEKNPCAFYLTHFNGFFPEFASRLQRLEFPMACFKKPLTVVDFGGGVL